MIILGALLYLAYKIGTGEVPEEKKNLAPKMCNGLSLSLIVTTLLLILSAFILDSHVHIRYNTYFLSNFYTTFLEILVLISGAFVLYNSTRFVREHPKTQLIEYPLLVITAVWFLLILLIANHFLIVFIGLVGFSLNLYVMITMFGVGPATKYNKIWSYLGYNSCHEASIKYFYLSAFSSAFVLLSIVLLYTITHTLNFSEVSFWLSQVAYAAPGYLVYWKDLLFFFFLALTIGFAFKLSAFPSHYWAPEVYEGSANPVTAFIIMPVKIAAFGIFARMLTSLFNYESSLWSSLVLVIAVGSLIVGALGAFTEKKFKRFIAFSSINQVGFLLLGLVTANVEGLQSSILFLIIYIITNIALFTLFFQLKTQDTGSSITYITDFNRLKSGYWASRFGWTFVFFSLAGLPPFAGFFGKFYVLMNAFQGGYLFSVFVGIFTSTVSAYYYLRIVKLLWFERGPQKNPFIKIQDNSLTALTLGLTHFFLLFFLIINDYMLELSRALSSSCYFPFSSL